MENLGEFPPFSFMNKLTPNEQNRLVSISHKQSFSKGNYIFQANHNNDSIYILLEGRVKIIRLSHEGRELIQWFCMTGEIFGLSEDNHSSYRGLYAQALSNSQLLVIAKQEFNQYLLSHPHLALLIVKQLASRLRTLGDMLLNMSSDDAPARFQKLLQRLCNCYGRQVANGIHIDVHLTHQQMADMIGVCRQTVSSILGKLKSEGVLTANRSGILIHSPQTLVDSLSHPGICRPA